MNIIEAFKKTVKFTPSHSLAEAFMLAGVPTDHGAVYAAAHYAGQTDEGDPAAFIARLTNEQGHDALLRAWWRFRLEAESLRAAAESRVRL